jgi:tRNA(fMet)-specific endonuclease VapC
MPEYMLDTDIASYIMKRSNPAVLSRLRSLPASALCISAITNSELQFGLEFAQRKQSQLAAFELLLRYVEVLDYPAEAAADYGQIRSYLKSRGTMIGANDLFIAAHARCLGLTLVTNNTREFGRVPGLKMENWTE